ncbi:MAG: VWA domain-containing protein [Cyanobacteria bacterium SZAS TMP-1]|nr:VWA domain-containing protein [Cyanobacteria bacterium SZAS TMP-1]
MHAFMPDFHWLRPQYLYWLLIALPVMASLLYLSYTQRRAARRAWGEEELIERFTQPINPGRELVRGALCLTAVALTVIAAAGPSLSAAPQVVQEGSMHLIAVVDVSPSMAAEDYRAVMPPQEVTDGKGQVIKTIPADRVVGPYGMRLDMAKYVIRRQIMPTLERNKIGIVNYTGQGFIQADLTDDYTALNWIMARRMGINQAPGGGSDYAEGLKTALQMFREEKPNRLQKVILLFTDGGFTGQQSELNQVLSDIRQAGIRIIVVGVGASNAVPIPKYSSGGQVVGYMEEDGKTVQTAIDEAALQTLVLQTGGQYIRLDPAAPPDVKIQWAGSFGNTKTELHEDPAFQYPLGAALAVMSILVGVGFSRLKGKP